MAQTIPFSSLKTEYANLQKQSIKSLDSRENACIYNKYVSVTCYSGVLSGGKMDWVIQNIILYNTR